jgi:adenylate cyclase
MALFGLHSGPQVACRQALEAAAMIAANVDELNRFLSHDLNEPIRFGIGIHGGEVIIGDIAIAITWCSPRLATRSMSRPGCRR